MFNRNSGEPRIRLLLATPEVSDIHASRTVLQSSAVRFDVDSATDVQSTLKKLQSKQFDVVLLDPGLVNGDGPPGFHEIMETAGSSVSTVLLVHARGNHMPEELAGLNSVAMLSVDTLRSEHLPERIEECMQVASAARNGEVDTILVPRQGESSPLFSPGSDRVYRMIIENLQEGIITVDANGAILFTNVRVGDMLGCDPDRLLGLGISELVGPEELVLLETKMEEALRGSSARCELQIAYPGAEAIQAMLSLHRIDDVGDSPGISLAMIDLSEEKRLRDELERLSITDALTRLYNRRQLDRTLQVEWNRSARYGRSLSCLMIDVDDFKQVNDKYGHLAGDETLRQVASRLANAVRETDFVARYGGEEFCVLLPETAIDGAVELAGRMQSIIADKPIDIGGRAIRVTISIGVGDLDHRDDVHADALISRSDMALSQAKSEGKNCVRAIRA